MKETILKFSQLLSKGKEYIENSPIEEFTKKERLEKWSKQEILGHLIDSAVNNLQRFTEIQFEEKPYVIRKYNQDELVKVNDYQNANRTELLHFWMSINYRIIAIMKLQTEATLGYKIVLGDHEISDLKFLMQDYVAHLEHHLQQLTIQSK
ncbi:DinB family protein [Flammeovirga agarivorans]|uniref:DinB family protein n=1 Tax=Flammeovirga agarivorans TaxID=2726742 RepID=A0A7X8XVK9_9BACT|nr:DinB family protein [Flammeovirga agarivorans]NLR91442.1 DinB family protein [Flammeovirga agarivorans]